MYMQFKKVVYNLFTVCYLLMCGLHVPKVLITIFLSDA